MRRAELCFSSPALQAPKLFAALQPLPHRWGGAVLQCSASVGRDPPSKVSLHTTSVVHKGLDGGNPTCLKGSLGGVGALARGEHLGRGAGRPEPDRAGRRRRRQTVRHPDRQTDSTVYSTAHSTVYLCPHCPTRTDRQTVSRATHGTLPPGCVTAVSQGGAAEERRPIHLRPGRCARHSNTQHAPPPGVFA